MSRPTTLRRVSRIVTGPDESGSVYVYFRPSAKRVAQTLKHHGMVNLDYDSLGRLVGIELLAVPKELPR